MRLSVAAFAQILARIERDLDSGPALAEAGIDEAQWASEKEAFVAEARERPMELPLELARAFAEARQALEKPEAKPTDAQIASPQASGPLEQRLVPSGDGPQELPTYLRPDVPRAGAAQSVSFADPDATTAAPIPVAASVVLPFSGDRSEAHLRELAASPVPKREESPAGAEETLLAPQLVLLETVASGSFRDALAPVVVPQLSVEDYADLRARLVVFGEDHTPSLRHHGVLSLAAKEALERTYRDQFAADPALRGRFEAAIRERARHYRRGDS